MCNTCFIWNHHTTDLELANPIDAYFVTIFCVRYNYNNHFKTSCFCYLWITNTISFGGLIDQKSSITGKGLGGFRACRFSIKTTANSIKDFIVQRSIFSNILLYGYWCPLRFIKNYIWFLYYYFIIDGPTLWQFQS